MTFTSDATNNRLTISVDFEDERLADTPVSIVVESTNNQPVVVERAMWWPSPNWYEGHITAGTTTTATKWALAEGQNGVFDTYILIANTGPAEGTATLTFVPSVSEGARFEPERIQVTLTLPPNSRTNFNPSGLIGSLTQFGTIVESDGVPIVVERAMYKTTNGLIWSVGTNAVATKLQ